MNRRIVVGVVAAVVGLFLACSEASSGFYCPDNFSSSDCSDRIAQSNCADGGTIVRNEGTPSETLCCEWVDCQQSPYPELH